MLVAWGGVCGMLSALGDVLFMEVSVCRLTNKV